MAIIIPIIGKNAETVEQTEIPVIGKNAETSEGKVVRRTKTEVRVSEQIVIPTPGTSGSAGSAGTGGIISNLLPTINPAFDCIVNAKKGFQIKLYKSRLGTVESIYELLTDFIDGEATELDYYIDNRVELIKRTSGDVVYSGTWSCTGTDSFKICWDGKCSPVYIGVSAGISMVSGDESCCTGSSGSAGTSGSSGTSGTAATSGTAGTGGSSFSCPSGYNVPCPTLDEVRDCDNRKSFKPCMKCPDIKKLQEIPALASIIEEIQDRDNKPKKTDEYYGPIMKEAVEILQAKPSRDLVVDGKIGCKTLDSLESFPDNSIDDTQIIDVTVMDDDTTPSSNQNTGTIIPTTTASTTKPIKKSFQVDRSFFNPNDEW